MNISLDPVRRRARRHIEIVRRLKVHPELGRHSKVARQPQRSVGRDAATAIDDLIDYSSFGQSRRRLMKMRRLFPPANLPLNLPAIVVLPTDPAPL